MKHPEFEKSKIFDVVAMNDYVPNGVHKITILKKETGNVNAVFIDIGEELTDELSRFDHIIQIVEGKADVLIDDNSYSLVTGQSIIIPAHSKNKIKAIEKIKLISTIIKSGYE